MQPLTAYRTEHLEDDRRLGDVAWPTKHDLTVSEASCVVLTLEQEWKAQWCDQALCSGSLLVFLLVPSL